MEKIGKCGIPARSFDETYRTAVAFLSNPRALWASGRYEHRRALLRLAFSAPLIYDRNQGYRTAPIAQPFRPLGQLSAGKYGMVPGGGTESNDKIGLLGHWESKDEGDLTPSEREELFDTLARWNEYLEKHVPYYRDGGLEL